MDTLSLLLELSVEWCWWLVSRPIMALSLVAETVPNSSYFRLADRWWCGRPGNARFRIPDETDSSGGALTTSTSTSEDGRLCSELCTDDLCGSLNVTPFFGNDSEHSELDSSGELCRTSTAPWSVLKTLDFMGRLGAESSWHWSTTRFFISVRLHMQSDRCIVKTTLVQLQNGLFTWGRSWHRQCSARRRSSSCRLQWHTIESK